MSVYANISIDQGSTFRTTVTCSGSNGTLLDLTGYTARAQMRRSYSSSTSVDFECEIEEPESGEIIMSLAADVTGGLKAQRYVYDLEITSPDDEVTRVVEGQVEVTPRVTLPED